MIAIPFTKLHGDQNDFLLTWADQVPGVVDLLALARSICARITGVGADGWMLVWRTDDGLRTRLFNSDGSEPEISGNGTRCAAAFAIHNGSEPGQDLVITTAAGPKKLHLLEHNGVRFRFEMDMGLPQVDDLRASLRLAGSKYEASLLNVGNPQCAIFVDHFPENWISLAAAAEAHPRFPNRSNVSFVRVVDRHTIEARFFERGAGQTRSSGTGSTGAAAAAILRKDVQSPVVIRTPAGTLTLRWDDSVFLTGPAELVAEGSYFIDG